MTDLTESDWLQIEMAARGCIGGTSDEWPNLRSAIEKITGRPFGPRKRASWLRGFCEGVMVQAGRESDLSRNGSDAILVPITLGLTGHEQSKLTVKERSK